MSNVTKAGARHNSRDQATINKWHKNADELKADMAELGAAIEEAQAEAEATTKASAPPIDVPAAIFGFVKAAGDWELDVLANPYGGPNNGADADGEKFTPRTKFHEDKIPFPPVVYYHGFGDDKRPMGQPEFIGNSVKRWVNEQGVWYRVVLDRANQFAKRAWEAAQRGAARASTGVVLATHRVDKMTGEILSWLNGEISIFETDTGKQPANGYAVAIPALKAVYAKAQLTFPDDVGPEAEPTGGNATGTAATTKAGPTIPTSQGVTKMNDDIKAAVAAALAEERAHQEAEKKAEDEKQAAIKAAVEVEKAKWEKAQAANGRLPLGDGQAPYAAKFGETWKFDNLDPADNALMVDLLNAQKRAGRSAGPSNAAYKALALKLESSKDELDNVARGMFKATGLKANELDYSTQSSYGDEWVGVAYSTRLWEAVRANTFVGERLMQRAIEVPPGMESIKLPLESTDMTWYKVAQTTDNNATTGIPDATVTASKLGTAQGSLSLVKMGARTLWSGEMEEDSLIPWVANLRRQLELSGSEQLEHAIIDGDTETGATTNINDIGGTPAGTEVFLLVNGFRKSPLVTTTANSRSGGALTAEDFLETVKLMGMAGKNSYDKRLTEFIVDAHTAWKALEIPEVKTRDVFSAPTIENGVLTGIYGYKVNTSYFMHYANQNATYGLKANSAGKTDLDTAANNLYGAILAVRFDQWQFGIRRRMTVETQRIPQADATQIVALMRWGLTQRDTEASAITYGVVV